MVFKAFQFAYRGTPTRRHPSMSTPKDSCSFLAKGRLSRHRPLKPSCVPRSARQPQHSFPPPRGLCRTYPLPLHGTSGFVRQERHYTSPAKGWTGPRRADLLF